MNPPKTVELANGNFYDASFIREFNPKRCVAYMKKGIASETLNKTSCKMWKKYLDSQMNADKQRFIQKRLLRNPEDMQAKNSNV